MAATSENVAAFLFRRMKIEQNLNEQLSELCTHTRIRQLGSYYTPDLTASALARWAIRTGHESFLEPSAGGGALLIAALSRANELARYPAARATAFDIDPEAIEKLHALDIDQLTVYKADFLEHPFFEKFDLVLANPPFNRNHSLTPQRRSSLRDRMGVSGAIGLWGYFLLHSLNFLKSGGRLASIVPRSILFTRHGEKYLKNLCGQFSEVGVFELSARPSWSNFADEAGAVILAEGFGGRPCNQYRTGTLNEDGVIAEKSTPQCQLYDRAIGVSVMLGTLANLSIGVVTGRNKVFLLSENERKDAGLSLTHVRPVISRSRQLSGLFLSTEDLHDLAVNGHKTWLLAPKKFYAAVSRYLAVVPAEDIEAVVWFRKRKPWWKVQISENIDAVFTYMNDLGPRIVAVSPGVVCTNTLHRVTFFNSTAEAQRRGVFLTAISTFGQLAAERVGRSYGGGVLKFELAEARRLPVISSANFSESLLLEVDRLLKAGCIDDARKAVDEAFMPEIFGVSWKAVTQKFADDLLNLRYRRRGKIGSRI